MKNTCKILALVLVLMMMFAMASMFTVSAETATTKTVYFKPSSNGGWIQNNERYAVYTWGTSTVWVDLVDSNGDNVFEAEIPSGNSTVIFCRMNGSTTVNSWDNKWDQTQDITLKTDGIYYYSNNGTKDGQGKFGYTTTAYTPPAHSHTFEVSEEKSVAATCHTDGKKVEACSDPDCTYEKETVLKAGHTLVENVCSVCGFDNTKEHTVVVNAGELTGLKCYAYGSGEYKTWPGEAMTQGEDGLWTYVIPAGYTYFIANWGNGDDNQTVDMVIPADNSVVTLVPVTGDKDGYTVHKHSFVEGKCECGETDPDYVAPHVNQLIVGQSNKIVVDGSQTNVYNLPVAWVQFTVEEAARYTFLCAEQSALALIYTTDGTAYDYYGPSANLAPGTYWVCVGGGAVGEFNVTVYQTPSQNLAITANPLFPCFYNILVEGELTNGIGPVVWVEFTVAQEAHYKFECGKAPAFIYTSNADFTDLTTIKGSEADLTPGTYYVLVGGTGETGYFNLSVTQTAIEEGGDEPGEEPAEDPVLNLGDNTVVIDDTTGKNLSGKPIAWYTFTPEEAGVYTFTSELTVFILTSKNMSDVNAYVSQNHIAQLEAGKTYNILVGKEGITGEFAVNVSKASDDVKVPVKNTMVVGDNHYVVVDGVGFEFLTIEITEPGTYVITGGAPMKVYFFTVLAADVVETSPFAWNVDTRLESGFADSFKVTISEPGTYMMGFNYEFVKEDSPREYDINISLEEEPELNFFQKIIAWFMDLIQKLLAMFKK